MKYYLIKDEWDDTSVCIVKAASQKDACMHASIQQSDLLEADSELYAVELPFFDMSEVR